MRSVKDDFFIATTGLTRQWLTALLLACCSAPVLAQDSMTFQAITRCDALNAERNKPTDCVNPPLELGAGDVWLGQGKIERKTEDVFGDVAKNLPAGSIVVLNSLGGDLVGGLRLGQSIRARNFHTWILDAQTDLAVLRDKKNNGKCFSSCAYAFMGGVKRLVDKGGLYGVHQFRNVDDKLDAVQAQKISALLARYLDAMGVNRQLLDLAMLTEPGKITVINESQRANWNVETSVTRAVTASRWKLEAAAGGKRLAYSSVRQSQRQSLLTFALTYINGQPRALLIAKPDARDELAPDWLSAFNDRIELLMEINGKLLVLQPVSDWQAAGQVNTPGTRQIWFAIKPDVTREMLNAKQFKLKPQWAFPPLGMDGETVFSTDGFNDNFSAL